MKKFLATLLIPLLFVACNESKQDQPQQVSRRDINTFAALAATISPDSIQITPSGDTMKWYHNEETISSTYDVPYVIVVGKKDSTVIPPDTTTVPGETFPLSFTQIPFSSPDLNRPQGGAEQWHDRNDVNLGYTPKDVYWRFVWTRLEGRTQGSYNWAYFDNLVNQAITKKQKFSFGIMTVYPDGTTNEGLQTFSQGGLGAYPEYIHNFMQAQSVKDWRTGNTWTPNYNHTFYTDRLLALHQALATHINTTSFNGVPYKNVIQNIDIRGYGAWGEWHSGYTPNNVVSDYPSGTFPTVASLKRIVDAHTQGFPDFQLVCMIAGFDAMWLNNTKNPNEIAYYLLTTRNQKGLIGWRRDQWGATDSYLSAYLENNTRSFNGLQFKDSIMVRYKSAPITGEPPAWSPDAYSQLESQIRLYHATSFGNGNYGTAITTQISDRVKASSKAAGYRLSPTSGTLVTRKGAFDITLNWTNTGIAPTYENWTVVFELINSSNVVVRSVTSQFTPKLFMGTKQIIDKFTGLPSGTYKLNMRVSEPYRGNMPLFVTPSNTDGSITLKTNVIL